MRHGGNPDTGAHGTLNQAGTAVRHPDTPLTGIARVIRKVHAVHHVIFMTVDVLVAKAADIVHLCHRSAAVAVRVTVPGVLVHGVFYQAVRHVRVDGTGFLVADRVRHPAARRAASSAAVRMLAGSALLLAVATAVLGIEQVGNTRVHQRVYLLHASLGGVIMEIRPAHARRSAAAGNAGAQLRSHHRTAHNRTKVLVIRHPVGLQILDLVRVTQDYLVELRRVQYGEVKGSGTRRDFRYQVHARLELVA